ncbi:MAG: hypothetical protein HQL60_03085 [Magnetococcales bacterium]|nr:hypothetical protein [Magnetococcales bacterium]
MIAQAVGLLLVGYVSQVAAEGRGQVSYKDDIQPIIQIRCLECHQVGGDGLAYSGLDLSSYEGLIKGTKHGPVVTPGDALSSNLNVLIEGRAGIRMPHNRRSLTKCEQEMLRNWVNQGAKNN